MHTKGTGHISTFPVTPCPHNITAVVPDKTLGAAPKIVKIVEHRNQTAQLQPVLLNTLLQHCLQAETRGGGQHGKEGGHHWRGSSGLCAPCTFRVNQTLPTINDDLPIRIISGRVLVKPNIQEFTETSVIFEDGTREDIDAVVFATGYSFSFPFLKGCVKVVENEISLYKFMFPPDLEIPTLAFIGLIQPLGAIMPISELQCRWATSIFKGKRDKSPLWLQPKPAPLESPKNREGTVLGTADVGHPSCAVLLPGTLGIAEKWQGCAQMLKTHPSDPSQWWSIKYHPLGMQGICWFCLYHPLTLPAHRYMKSRQYAIQVDYIPYMDELACQVGVKPNVPTLFLTDPKLALEVAFGPCTPYQYRLRGPGKWAGAREAILTQRQRITKPLQTRLMEEHPSASTMLLFFKLVGAVAILAIGLAYL
ncbi:flavin-containing monooxygenase 5-like [Lathamus discolor]|uniref:flavin-containing monooxygenase 5-like n=1 Tax=Lathamus discolor TaxID=678569 RepID=UPI0032B70961